MDALLHLLQPLFAPAFNIWGSAVTWLELLAFVLAIAMVVFNIRVNPLGWPLAIASSLLYFLLFWKSRLYGDASLQIFFVAVAGWGWWQWLRGTDAAGNALGVLSTVEFAPVPASNGVGTLAKEVAYANSATGLGINVAAGTTPFNAVPVPPAK